MTRLRLILMIFGWVPAAFCGTWTGILVDAGCLNRDAWTLRSPPIQQLATEPGARSVSGITIAPRVLKAERAEATLPDTPDHASRYSSASCALTAETRAFALLQDDGHLLNLDEGGNTLALESFQSTPAGHSILNGKTGGLKPRVRVEARRQGDTLKADSVQLANR